MSDAKKDRFDFYLEQVGESAKRSRLVLYLLLVSSAMIFAFDWKNDSHSWLRYRVDIRHDILGHWKQLKSGEAPEGMSSDAWEKEKKRELLALDRLNLNPKYDDDEEILKTEVEDFQKQWDEPYKVPFTEITIDINDFVFFAASEMLILAVVFLHAIVREEENLRISFTAMMKSDKAATSPSHKRLSEFYDMASMLQIWTVPDGLEYKVTKSFLRVGFWPIFFIPLLVIWWVLIRSALNTGSWDLLNPALGHEMIWLQYLATFLLTVTMMWAAFFTVRINQLWTQTYKVVQELEKSSVEKSETPK